MATPRKPKGGKRPALIKSSAYRQHPHVPLDVTGPISEETGPGVRKHRPASSEERPYNKKSPNYEWQA